jgi:hypothetical protein
MTDRGTRTARRLRRHPPSDQEVFWRRRIQQQARSGLSLRAWCAQHDVPEWAFYRWRAHLGRFRERPNAQPPFLPVRVAKTEAPEFRRPDEATVGGGLIEILWADRRRVRVYGGVDRQVLADVLAVLEREGDSASEGCGRAGSEVRPC